MFPVLPLLPWRCLVIDNLPGSSVLPPSGKAGAGRACVSAHRTGLGSRMHLVLQGAGPPAQSGFHMSKALADHRAPASSLRRVRGLS